MIATSIEQSEKLMELGIDTSTADMFWGYIRPWCHSDSSFDGGYEEYPLPKEMWVSEEEYSYKLPAWSLDALLKLIPSDVSLSKGTIRLQPYEELPDRWCCDVDDVHTTIEDAPLEAAFKMVCWLKENNHI